MAGWKKAVLPSLCILLLLAGYINRFSDRTSGTKDWAEDGDSFTVDQTYSYDEKYYAIQKAEKEPYGDGYVYYLNVYVYETETDTLVSCFCPARARDFHGICWENDTYNIWTQSGDIGVYCYKYEDMQWIRDESAKRPEYIISKYDKYKKSGE